jgi:hypothetical protein
MIILEFFSALFLTIIIEVIASIPFHIDKRIFILINLITNPTLNLILFLGNQIYDHFINIPIIITIEILVIIVEAFLIKTLTQKQTLKKAFLISFVINTISFCIGTPIINFIFE